MTNEEIRAYLEKEAESEYQKFSASLIPESGELLGVRLPKVRILAKELAKGDWKVYLDHAADDSFEEIILQAYTLGYVKTSPEEIIPYIERFLPKNNNWSVNDGLCSNLKIIAKNRAAFIPFIERCMKSDKEFDLRVAAILLMDYYLVPEYIDYTLNCLNQIHHEAYYTRMGVAWAIATAYAKFPTETMRLLQDNDLDDFTFNKAIQKMIESYRVSDADKVMLRAMKRKGK